MGLPGLFFVYLLVFSKKQYNFYHNLIWKSPSSIWCQDLNPQPLARQSPPMTTRLGLPPTPFHDSFLFRIEKSCFEDFLLKSQIYFVLFCRQKSFKKVDRRWMKWKMIRETSRVEWMLRRERGNARVAGNELWSKTGSERNPTDNQRTLTNRGEVSLHSRNPLWLV